MKNRYSFTGDGLHNVAVYSIEPAEIWQVLHSARRLIRPMSEDANAVFGVTAKARFLVIFVVESPLEDNDWDIIAGREMYPDEVAMFSRLIGGQK